MARKLSPGEPYYFNCFDQYDAVFKLIKKYLDKSNIVPGFADVLMFSRKKILPIIRREHRDNWKDKIRGVNVCSPGDIARNFDDTDIVFIDANELPLRDVEDLIHRFHFCPIIVSGKKPKGMQVIIDTREQKPLWDNAKVMKLEVGDYTTERLMDMFHVERKSPQDLYGSIIQGHVRFRKEMIYANIRQTKLVVFVETTRENFINKKFPGGAARNCTSEKLLKMINTIQFRYKLEFVWCGSRNNMKRLLLQRFRDEEKKLK